MIQAQRLFAIRRVLIVNPIKRSRLCFPLILRNAGRDRRLPNCETDAGQTWDNGVRDP
jgi:hypothetical protein